MLILLASLLLLAGILPYAFVNGGVIDRSAIGLMLLTSEIALGIIYGISRTRHYVTAAVLTVTFTSASMFAMASSTVKSGDIDLLVYLVVPMLLSSMLLGTRLTFLLLIGQVGGMVALVTSSGMDGIGQPWMMGVAITSSLVLATDLQQRLIHRDNNQQLLTSETRYRAVSELSYDFAYAFGVDPQQM